MLVGVGRREHHNLLKCYSVTFDSFDPITVTDSMYCFIVVALKAWGQMRCGEAATRRNYRLFMTI